MVLISKMKMDSRLYKTKGCPTVVSHKWRLSRKLWLLCCVKNNKNQSKTKKVYLFLWVRLSKYPRQSAFDVKENTKFFLRDHWIHYNISNKDSASGLKRFTTIIHTEFFVSLFNAETVIVVVKICMEINLNGIVNI